jgi:hypothetical protein
MLSPVSRFFEENDMQNYLLEQLSDLHWFFNVFPEIIFNKENGNLRKRWRYATRRLFSAGGQRSI